MCSTRHPGKSICSQIWNAIFNHKPCPVGWGIKNSRIMYYYTESEPGLYTVGYYLDNDEWIAESDHEDKQQAAARVAWLNGQPVKPASAGPDDLIAYPALFAHLSTQLDMLCTADELQGIVETVLCETSLIEPAEISKAVEQLDAAIDTLSNLYSANDQKIFESIGSAKSIIGNVSATLNSYV